MSAGVPRGRPGNTGARDEQQQQHPNGPIYLISAGSARSCPVVGEPDLRHEHGTAGGGGVGVKDHKIVLVGVHHVLPARILVRAVERVLVEELSLCLTNSSPSASAVA